MNEKTEEYTHYPLFNLYIEEDQLPIRLEPGVSIELNNINCQNEDYFEHSKVDIAYLKDTQLVLKVSEQHGSAKVSLQFMLACRLLKRTEVFLRYKYWEKKDICKKVFDDYPVIVQGVDHEIMPNEIDELKVLYSRIELFRKKNTRFNNVIYFVSLAYRSMGWLETLLHFVNAIETVSSSNQFENKTTQRFSKRVEKTSTLKMSEATEIYEIRSKLVHGRLFAEENNEQAKESLRLAELSERACREILKPILLGETFDQFQNEDVRYRHFGESTYN